MHLVVLPFYFNVQVVEGLMEFFLLGVGSLFGAGRIVGVAIVFVIAVNDIHQIAHTVASYHTTRALDGPSPIANRVVGSIHFRSRRASSIANRVIGPIHVSSG